MTAPLHTPEVCKVEGSKMPGRLTPLVNGEFYHIINRGVASLPVFIDQRDYQRSIETIFYYQKPEVPVRYSQFIRLSPEQRMQLLKELKNDPRNLVEIIAYCLMPNHLHLLLRQVTNKGISTFMGNFANSYVRYFNTKRQRIGPLFQGRFRAVRIGSESQLLHLSRYIHLNPLSAQVVKSLTELKKYPYSSLPEYVNSQSPSLCNKATILTNFKDVSAYEDFVLERANYQKSLEEIKHLLLEK